MDKLSSKLLEKRPSQVPTHPYSTTTTLTSTNSQLYVKKPPPIINPPISSIPKTIRKPKTPNVPKVNTDKVRPMTIYEKRKLCEDIKSLTK